MKFRAWDEKTRWMHQPRRMSELMSGGFYWENKICMQFTGLLDKNGKEIYEGDIGYIGSEVAPANGECKCEVKFSNGCFSLFAINENRLWRMHELELNRFYFRKTGNRYENPELLK